VVTIGQDQKDQKDGVLNMNNLEEMRRFFQTYGDQDANAMPDMFNEIDTTSESYMGVPVNEFGEKLNPTGRAMDSALRTFFGLDKSLGEGMEGLDNEPYYEDDDAENGFSTAYEEGVPPILKKVTTETLSPIERSAPEGTFGFGPVADGPPLKLLREESPTGGTLGQVPTLQQSREASQTGGTLGNVFNNTKQQMSPELLNRIVRMLAT
jgi:hypothetical protein